MIGFSPLKRTRFGLMALAIAAAFAAAPADAQNRYGSIVFSQEAGGGYAWGMAWSYSSLSEATRQARGECRRRGGSRCSQVGWFRNACGSLAIGDRNGYGTGWADSASRASYNAMASCRSSNRNCRTEITRCAN